jgi:hypothetical protein
MIWIGVVVAIPVLAVVAMAVVGSLLPKEFSGRAEAVFKAPPTAVWEAIQDYSKHPMCQSESTGFEKLPDENGLPSWREQLGTRDRIVIRTTAAEAPARLTRELSSEVVPMKARWSFELSPEGSGTRVTIVQTGVIESGTWHVPFFRAMMRLFDGASAGPRNFLDAVRRTLGEEPAK